MGIMTRPRWRLAAAVAVSVLLVLLALMFQSDTPATPAVVRRPAQPPPLPAASPLAQPQQHLAQVVPVGVRHDYIVQAASVAVARSAVARAGGIVTGELAIIRSVGAALDERELAALRDAQVPSLQIYDDAMVTASGAGDLPETYYPTEVSASDLHVGGVTGRGVTVAVLDSGVWHDMGPLQRTSENRDHRVLAQYDVILAREKPDSYKLVSEKYDHNIDDLYGHGTHVTSVIASSGLTPGGHYQGVAPGVNVISVRALDANGAGRYFDVIRGIDWVVNHRADYSIRVLNLSLGAPPQSYYWDDPLAQAVMVAWQSGIVVVVAAGNRGPHAMTIGVPGNVPYVITVGAVTDNYKPFDPNQYRLASFSSTGPTYEGFVKPEVVAPGGHILAYAPDNGMLAQRFPQWLDQKHKEFTMSGTSQAAAVVSGVVALMLEVNPLLSPDEVKCRLMSSARPALKPDGSLAYSVFQQGAGLVNAHDAVYSTASRCANQGLNLTVDLAGLKHFGGPANEDASGNFYLMDVSGGTPLAGDGYTWSNGYTWSSGYTWSNGYTWSDGYTWSNGYTWSDGYTWSNTYIWSNGYTWSDSYTGSDDIPNQE
jgi:serine protease AprX